MKGTKHRFQQIGISLPAFRTVPRRCEQPPQISGRSSRFIAAGKEEEDIAEQLIAVVDQGTDNTILPVFRCALERKVHDKD